MIKKLVFNLFLSRETFDCEVNRLHFKCLETYANVFDEMLFVLSLDDINDLELIRMAENKLLQMHTNGTITFSVVKNTELRETEAFKREIVDKMPEEKLVFFGHNKGITNIKKYGKDNIMYWISGMYFFSLNYMDEVVDKLIGRPSFSYGSMLTKNDITNIRYGWAYIGTFFWINSAILYDHIKRFNIELPHCTNRFYDEEFLGNVYSMDFFALSHENRYLMNGGDYYRNSRLYVKLIYENNGLDEFNAFYDKIINELGINLEKKNEQKRQDN